MNVLFVDADEFVAESVSSVLRRKGHNCQTVGNGEQAIALAQQDSFDIVVLELSLPDMDGFDVIRRMKAERIEVPVLLQSGQSNKSQAIRTAQREGREVFAKPYIVTELIHRMEQTIGQAEVPDRLTRNGPVDGNPLAQAEPDPAPDPTPAPAPELAPEFAPELAAELALEEPIPGLPEPDAAESAGKSGSERRRAVRRQFIEAALITDASGPIPCVILNLSKTGAALKLPEPDRDCPSRFTLELLEGPSQRCEMRWRNGDRLGVAFI